jgi:hypothetical protein
MMIYGNIYLFKELLIGQREPLGREAIFEIDGIRIYMRHPRKIYSPKNKIEV